MNPKNERIPAVVKLLAGLLEEQSKFSWKAEQVGAVWVLAPASFLMLFPPPEGSLERWLRISPVVGESPLGRLRICILGSDAPQQFLLDVAVVVYAMLGLLMEIESGNASGNHAANAAEGSAFDRFSEHGAATRVHALPRAGRNRIEGYFRLPARRVLPPGMRAGATGSTANGHSRTVESPRGRHREDFASRTSCRDTHGMD